ncbi:NADH dehydrogenase [ubiquinone] 1 alpha subcomplex assembly factor 3 [Frankliniella occidentalis]|uniref:NADH dehydrogenase [ubiquinone] 1 alpha subcomplex assembly factor 3 n=1 Tax=Frankliniella occidentalis TaxID=133901 RepID=A0A6J1T531_FRAOC|nr:NADH dehydrogenase [ubiquinone] 1 alpha subcomplex assembly factor 3 [Frankliniella occidentalis]
MASIRNGLKAAFSFSKKHFSHEITRKHSRGLYGVRHYGSGAYDGDGKTHTVLLNDEGVGLMINAYSTIGFTLNNGTTVIGPMAIFPNCILSWNVGGIIDINEESLSLILNLYPKPDIFILGIPEVSKKMNKEKVNSLFRLITKRKIQCEILIPEIACPTFNFLLAEQRFVGAGILPPHNLGGEGSGDVGFSSFKLALPDKR